MCNHNLCFGAKIRKIGIPLHTPVLLYKSGVQGGIVLFTEVGWGLRGYTFHGHVFLMFYGIESYKNNTKKLQK